MYLAAIIDCYSRKILSWRLSISLHNDFCIEALEEALENYERPEIFNTDQGVQFTADNFTDKLIGEKIKISMDGKGRCAVACKITIMMANNRSFLYISCKNDGGRPTEIDRQG